MSKEKSVEEIREEFLDTIRDLAKYWDARRIPSKEKLEGLSFSIMTLLDGGCGSLPGYIVAPRSSKEDREYYISEGRDYYPLNNEINGDIAGCLHELINVRRMEIMNFKNLICTKSHQYESIKGEVDGKQFRIGRNKNQNNLFQEDLKGNLSEDEVLKIFSEIDNLRMQHKLL